MKDNEINLFEINRVDFNNIPNGANYIINNDMKRVAVLMNIEYYKYLEDLMLKLRDKLANLSK